mmetsp:Transcript_4967/g.7364  ORF Transcript_4967/g.7364 Transcript_4967/m.7364 type:complete len:254 (+) Transcript_4967:151-912(+)|eukprot:CAMPEP_0167755582 /NCGR_PEP_ID=MMETSP0110_2-20121227/8909_1 /TAXON_ID=629695 /ORGANISM="Gymnochlora sp., Strain CCMP2014" /LENGTH=253 /DNA_ID=CAMNT_0007641595 /DNA_START=128 /DNA_END=889 /DNA_ORIENTATION=+
MAVAFALLALLAAKSKGIATYRHNYACRTKISQRTMKAMLMGPVLGNYILGKDEQAMSKKRFVCKSAGVESSIEKSYAPDIAVLALEDVLIPTNAENDGLYKGIHYALNGCGMPYYIISKCKPERASESLLKADPDLFSDFSPDSRRLVCADNGLRALEDIQSRAHPKTKIHYVDSDTEVLNEVAEKMPMTRRYHATWASQPSASLDAQAIGLTEFVELMKMGIVMAYGIDSHRQFALDALYKNPATSRDASS